MDVFQVFVGVFFGQVFMFGYLGFVKFGVQVICWVNNYFMVVVIGVSYVKQGVFISCIVQEFVVVGVIVYWLFVYCMNNFVNFQFVVFVISG